MLLSELLTYLSEVKVRNFSECEVTDVEEDSSKISKGAIFVARRGVNFDGNAFVSEAFSRGACAAVTENETLNSASKTVIISKNASKTMAEIANALYGNVLLDMTVIGITGTKGKTSTLKILSECILSKGASLVTLGTLGIEIHGKIHEYYSSENTTPSSPFIYRILHRAYSIGCRFAIIEVSSQALSDFRVYGIPFDVCIFTNISRDHIGVNEHSDFDSYVRAKRSLFEDYGACCAIVNANDRNWSSIVKGCPRVIKVGVGCEHEYTHIHDTVYGCEFLLDGHRFLLPVGGEFNGVNAALAIVAAAFVLKCGIGQFFSAVSGVVIPGRYEVYMLRGIRIVIDFAHNARSVSAVSASVRKHTEGKLILVFGSVGGRCHSRRSELARAAEKFADLSVITSDNPGNESGEDIAREIFSNFTDKNKATVIPDREKAIIYAVAHAKAGDSILLLGKGQENYQLIGKEKIPFSERDIIMKLGAFRTTVSYSGDNSEIIN